LKIRIAAPPVEESKCRLIAFIAEIFDVPIKQVRLLRGESARQK